MGHSEPQDDVTFVVVKTHEAMFAFPVVESPVAAEVFELAVDLYRSARRAGLTIRSGTDCVIGACALRNSLPVLHRDRDCDALARVASLEVRFA